MPISITVDDFVAIGERYVSEESVVAAVPVVAAGEAPAAGVGE